jgi:K+-sensing histidine kinase KdpD
MLASGSTLGVPIWLIPSAAGAIAAVLGMWWWRERRVDAQRESMRAFHKLSEEIIEAESPKDIAEKLASVLPTVTSATAATLYLHNRKTKSLERVATDAEPAPMAAPIDDPPEGLSNAVVLCFRDRKLLSIPDVRRNPLINLGAKTGLPKSAMFVPLLSHQDVLGVLEVQNSARVGYFKPEEQAAVQHLANQATAALKLQDQQAMREQLFRGEKLAATGRLISGVASELRAPLDAIVQLAESIAGYIGRPAPERDLGKLETEARRASEIVARLVSFAREESTTPEPVDVNTLVASLTRFREPEWQGLGLRIQNKLSPARAIVTGVRGQLEQVFLNLIVHAEQRAAEAPPKTIGIQSSVIAGRVVVEISFSTQTSPPGERETGAHDPFTEGAETGVMSTGAMSLDVCQGIIQGHGGEIRRQMRAGTARFEVELPIAQDAARDAAANASLQVSHASRQLTLMLVEADADMQRQLLGSLASRGHRAVPVAAEEAAEVVQRLRFDAILWAVRSSGGRWSDFRERASLAVPAFVLISDGYDRELARSLEESGGYLLARPIDDAELDRILAEIGVRTALSAPGRGNR